MKKLRLKLLTLAVCTLAAAVASHAQEGGRPPGGEGGRSNFRNPFAVAFDTNNDGVIDEKEIANASAALKKLDKDGDGKITQVELRALMPQRGERGQAQANPEEMVNNLMKFDKNADGKLTKDELPERMQAMLERGDTDKDGALSKDEIRAMALKQAAAPARPRGEEHDRD